MHRRQLPSQVRLGHASLSLTVVPFEEISYFLGAHRKFFWHKAFKEDEVVVKRAKTFHIDINRSEQVLGRDLLNLVLALLLQLVF